jgi:BirA family biotin operon repressor/biotin-[acetyl-CoA-carboxylase] ligase
VAATTSSLPDFTVLTYEVLPSTQDLVRERLAAGECVHGLVVRARKQTSGRGQRARDWLGGLGGSYQTLALRTDAPQQLSRPDVSLGIAIGIAEMLAESGIKVGIKWPNDLLYRDKKLAGILCERVQGHLLVGVGMNVINRAPAAGIGLPGFTPEEAGDLVLEGIRRGLRLLLDGEDLSEAFARFDLLCNRPIEIELGREVVQGIARGIDSNGFLQLERGEGVLSIPHGRPERGPIRRGRQIE